MRERVVTVFGGTGFLGQRVVPALAAAGFHVRVAARRPSLAGFEAHSDQLEAVEADILNESSVAAAVEGASAVVNAVGLYVEKGRLTFESVHVEGAARVARCAGSAGVQQLISLSGIGVDENSPSAYVRSRAHGENAVRAAFKPAVILRPSVMFACRDAFLNALVNITRLPVVPLFGDGSTRLQPVYVEDVAKAIVPLCEARNFDAKTFELGGAKTYTYREAVATVAAHFGRKRLLMTVPFPVWHAMAGAMAVLPNPPLTRDQLALMEMDNVVDPNAHSFAALGIRPRSLESLLPQCFPR